MLLCGQGTPGPTPPAAPPTQVILIAGASNQTPRTSATGLAAQYVTPGGLYAYDTDGIAGHQVSTWTATGPVAGRFGEELPIAYVLTQAGFNVRIINFARGGTTFKTDWIGGALYLDQALTFYQDQLALIPGGESYEVVLQVLGFGASDGETNANASVFATSLATGQGSIQAVFPGLPCVINQASNQLDPVTVAFLSTIRSQILSWQAASPTDRYVTNIDTLAGPVPGQINYTNGGQFYQNPPAPALGPDLLHYTQDGQIYLGTANAYQRLLYL